MISLTLYMEVLEMDHFVYDPLPGFVHFQAEGKLNSNIIDKRTIFPDLIFIHRMVKNPRYRCLGLPLLLFGVLKPRISDESQDLKFLSDLPDQSRISRNVLSESHCSDQFVELLRILQFFL